MGMRSRAPECQTVLPASDIRSGRAAANVSGPAGGQRAVHALGAPQTKFHHRLAPRGQANARGFVAIND